jgi:hypothetical protein
MQKIIFWVLVPVIVFAVALSAFAQGGESNKPGMVVVDQSVVKATVEAIDYQNRLVTLRGPEGNVFIVRADDRVKNLDQVKEGDLVVAEYYKSIALFVRGAGEGPTSGQMDTVQVAPRGEKPYGVRVSAREVTATVEGIDYLSRTVTLRRPDGTTVTFWVDPSVKKFNEVKVGDEVVSRYTEAVAISVQKP